MNDPEPGSLGQILLEPGGRLILPEKVMEEIVIETPGCDLWFNDKDAALGLRLLRGRDDPPYYIKRLSSSEGRVRGILEAGAFLDRVGFPALAQTRACEHQYFAKYHLLVIRVGQTLERESLKKRGFLDDFPALDD